MEAKVSLAAVVAHLESLSRSCDLGDIGKEMSECVVMSHLARFPRVDVLNEVSKDLETIAALDQRVIVSPSSHGTIAHTIDCGGLPTIAALGEVARLLQDGVQREGMSLVALRNTGGTRTLDMWVRLLARRRVIALFTWNGGPYVTLPAGGVEAFFGTNPFAYGVPTRGEPIVADFATSEIAFMDLMEARRAGTPLRDAAGLNSLGDATNDAEEVFVEPDSARLLPIGGGPKGSAISLLLEILTGAFAGGVMGREASPVHTAGEFAGLCIGIAPDLFTGADEFESRVDALASSLRSSKPRRNATSVRLPGDAATEAWLEAERFDTVPASEEFRQRTGLS